MTGRILGIGAGVPGGSAEILLKEALQAADESGAEVQLVRLEELRLPSGPDRDGSEGSDPEGSDPEGSDPEGSDPEGSDPDGSDDAWWLWEQLLEADGLIISAPIMSRTVPARLKIVVDRLLGPNADRAIVEELLAMRRRGEEPVFAFRADERVLKPRVAGFIAVGGSLTPQWKALALPGMHLLTFSMQTAVVDQFVVSGTGTPQSVVLDAAALARARQLGAHVESQLGRSFEEAEYGGPPGLCPLCHLDVIELRGRAVMCATCGAQGRLSDAAEVEWTDLATSVISMADKRAHFEEILDTASQHAKVRDTIDTRAAAYADRYPPLRPQASA